VLVKCSEDPRTLFFDVGQVCYECLSNAVHEVKLFMSYISKAAQALARKVDLECMRTLDRKGL
jgi:hypothetical protein